MLDMYNVDRAGSRRILACPYCQRLQHIVPQPALFDIACKDCDRLFRVTEAGAVAIVEAAPAAGGFASERPTNDRWRPMLDRLTSVAIAVLAIAVVVEASRQLTNLGAARSVGRRALLEGSMTAPAGDMARELVRERDGRREALARYDGRIAAAAGDPSLQTLWRDLKRRDSEEVQLLDRRLAEVAREARYTERK